MAGARLGAAMRQIGRLFDEGTATGLADSQLLERFVTRGDGVAFSALVERHGPMVLGVCRAVIGKDAAVEDAFQATFLVLIRKAASIRGRDTLGGWLHRVAYRIAVQSRIERTRRRNQEHAIGDAIESLAAPTSATGDDWKAALYEELARLPEKYRRPIVLCYLEGRTHAQAASELGWGEATIRRRLSGARELLHARLSRRGLGLSLVVLTEALAKESTAAVPRVWINALTKAAVAMPAGKIVATGAISATAAKLAQTTLTTLFAAQVKGIVSVSALLIAATMIGSHLIPTGVVRAGADEAAFLADSPPSPHRRLPPAARKPDPDRAEDAAIPIVGRVLDPSGKPLAGAMIHCYQNLLSQMSLREGRTTPNAITDAEGRFRVVDSGLRPIRGINIRGKTTVAASAEGYGPAWTLVGTADEAEDVTLTVVKDDVPIIGRVLDLEGRPIRGVRISPSTIYAVRGEDLSAWERGLPQAKNAAEAMVKWSQPHDWTKGPAIKMLNLSRFAKTVPVAITDDQGRFKLLGIGRERIASLLIEGPTIASSTFEVHARTRPGPTYRLPNVHGHPQLGYTVYHGPIFDYVAAPTRPIVGTVRDKETGRPLAGVSIRADNLGARTTSDAQGRYRLIGLPRVVSGEIVATPPRGEPYLERELGRNSKIPPSPGDGPASLDITMKRGMTIQGKVTDRATGKPVFAYVDYFALPENPHIEDAWGMPSHGGGEGTDGVLTRPDGSYELVGLPGRGLVSVLAVDGRYLAGQGSETVIKADTPDSMALLQTAPGLCIPRLLTAVSPINPPEDAESIVCDISLEPGRTISGKIEDPEGKPLKGIFAIGLLSRGSFDGRMNLDSDEFTAFALNPAKPRRLFFHHTARKLAGTVEVRGDEKEPLVLRLKPAATIVGRLLDEDRHPVSDAHIQVPNGVPSAPILDNSGRFRIECLAAGHAQSVICRRAGGDRFSNIVSGVILEPGEVKDLGDIVVKPEKSP